MSEINEAHKLGDRIKITNHPTLKGVIGHIAEIRHGSYKGAPKTYTIDYQHPKHKTDHVSSIQLDSKYFKQHPVGQLGEAELSEELEEGLLSKVRDKILGVEPSKPAYKVGQTVSYETSPAQKDWKDGGRGKGKIDQIKGGHYIINGNPVNHFEIKKVHESEEVNELSIDTLKSYSDKAGPKADKLAKQGENSKNLKTSYKKFRDATMTLASKARADKKVREKEWQDKIK